MLQIPSIFRTGRNLKATRRHKWDLIHFRPTKHPFSSLSNAFLSNNEPLHPSSDDSLAKESSLFIYSLSNSLNFHNSLEWIGEKYDSVSLSKTFADVTQIMEDVKYTVSNAIKDDNVSEILKKCESWVSALENSQKLYKLSELFSMMLTYISKANPSALNEMTSIRILNIKAKMLYIFVGNCATSVCVNILHKLCSLNEEMNLASFDLYADSVCEDLINAICPYKDTLPLFEHILSRIFYRIYSYDKLSRPLVHYLTKLKQLQYPISNGIVQYSFQNLIDSKSFNDVKERFEFICQNFTVDFYSKIIMAKYHAKTNNKDECENIVSELKSLLSNTDSLHRELFTALMDMLAFYLTFGFIYEAVDLYDHLKACLLRNAEKNQNLYLSLRFDLESVALMNCHKIPDFAQIKTFLARILEKNKQGLPFFEEHYFLPLFIYFPHNYKCTQKYLNILPMDTLYKNVGFLSAVIRYYCIGKSKENADLLYNDFISKFQLNEMISSYLPTYTSPFYLLIESIKRWDAKLANLLLVSEMLSIPLTDSTYFRIFIKIHQCFNLSLAIISFLKSTYRHNLNVEFFSSDTKFIMYSRTLEFAFFLLLRNNDWIVLIKYMNFAVNHHIKFDKNIAEAVTYLFSKKVFIEKYVKWNLRELASFTDQNNYTYNPVFLFPNDTRLSVIPGLFKDIQPFLYNRIKKDVQQLLQFCKKWQLETFQDLRDFYYQMSDVSKYEQCMSLEWEHFKNEASVNYCSVIDIFVIPSELINIRNTYWSLRKVKL